MQSVNEIHIQQDYTTLDTGSPHYVTLKSDIDTLDVKTEGKKIRCSSLFLDEGINVNFLKQIHQNTFAIRTYERGVEDETLSCGTGATAAAVAILETGRSQDSSIELNTRGGRLEVGLQKQDSTYKNVWLTGPVVQVYRGFVE